MDCGEDRVYSRKNSYALLLIQSKKKLYNNEFDKNVEEVFYYL
jgi:hypothetical protein